MRSAGADPAAYIHSYNHLPVGWQYIKEALGHNEGLFEAFGILIKTCISEKYYPYLFLIAIISGWAFTNTIRKNSSYFTSSMMLFMLSGTWVWMINGIRQFLAATLAFAASRLIVERKTLLYIIIILLLSGIHTSVLVLIPIYFLVVGKPFTKKMTLMLGIAVFAVLFTEQFTVILSKTIENTEYTAFTESQTWIHDDGSNVLRTLVFSVPVVLALIDRKNIRENAPPIICVSVNMSIICVCFSIIANVTSGILVGRIPIYFSLYNYILLPWLVNNSAVFGSGSKKLIKFFMYAFYLIFCILNTNIYYHSDLLHLYFS